ncbi:MAG: hypothetical protein KDK39_13630 [Leptospiraceae bacterium]|nr:hypothetical protein [Leptospiraceae bacterium]
MNKKYLPSGAPGFIFCSIMLKSCQEISSITEAPPGSIVRRQNADKDQQGRLIQLNEDNSAWVVAEVIDLKEGQFLAEGGIIRVEGTDRIFCSTALFGEDENSQKALDILKNWVLFGKSPQLQAQILEFVKTSFLPEQILQWKKDDELRNLFVPVQMRFKIGKYTEKVDLDKLRAERFRSQLAELTDGKHMTYVAFVPRDTTHEPMFFSIGTKPHLETKKVLGEQAFGFHPNHGGHIKCVLEAENSPVLLTDAGSNDLGGGIHASLAEAELITEALKSLYPEFVYRPLAGRGAFGLNQSY